MAKVNKIIFCTSSPASIYIFWRFLLKNQNQPLVKCFLNVLLGQPVHSCSYFFLWTLCVQRWKQWFLTFDVLTLGLSIIGNTLSTSTSGLGNCSSAVGHLSSMWEASSKASKACEVGGSVILLYTTSKIKPRIC